MAALVMFLPPILNDGDTLWQITTGNWILDHRAIPATDPFSFTAGDRPWFAHEWLAETIMAIAYRLAGMRGVMVLAAAATGLTAAIPSCITCAAFCRASTPSQPCIVCSRCRTPRRRCWPARICWPGPAWWPGAAA